MSMREVPIEVVNARFHDHLRDTYGPPAEVVSGHRFDGEIPVAEGVSWLWLPKPGIAYLVVPSGPHAVNPLQEVMSLDFHLKSWGGHRPIVTVGIPFETFESSEGNEFALITVCVL